MIRLKQVTTVLDETTLVFEADGFPDGTVRDVGIPISELYERVKQVRTLLGRPAAMQDVRETIIAVVNELRRGRQVLPERFNFSQYIDVDLEAQ